MTFTHKNKAIFALLCLVLLLLPACLPACGQEIVDPIGDLDEIDQWAPYLSEEESEALFGRVAKENCANLDGPYAYYIGRLYDDPEKTQEIVYRYNCETGETGVACQIPACPHTKGSGCPFEKLQDFGVLRTYRGGVLFQIEPTMDGMDAGVMCGLAWYSPETGEYRVICEDATNCYPTENFLYYDRYEPADELDSEYPEGFKKQLWRYDWESEKATLVFDGGHWNCIFYPITGMKKGEDQIYMYVQDSRITSEGGTQTNYRIERFDEATGERVTVYDGGNVTELRYLSAEYMLFLEYDTVNFANKSTVCHLMNLQTGEERILEDHVAGSELLTDRFVLYQKKDPTGEADWILCCYDIAAGEVTDSYPLYGGWIDGVKNLYRGRIVSFLNGPTLDENDNFVEIGDVLERDICTGKMRVVDWKEVRTVEAETE